LLEEIDKEEEMEREETRVGGREKRGSERGRRYSRVPCGKSFQKTVSSQAYPRDILYEKKEEGESNKARSVRGKEERKFQERREGEYLTLSKDWGGTGSDSSNLSRTGVRHHVLSKRNEERASGGERERETREEKVRKERE